MTCTSRSRRDHLARVTRAILPAPRPAQLADLLDRNALDEETTRERGLRLFARQRTSCRPVLGREGAETPPLISRGREPDGLGLA